jgi:DNA transformation protein and related proteins
MAVTDDFFRYVLEQLSGLRGVASRRMFGAVGLYSDGAFFGLISSDVLYFKVGDSNRPDYEAPRTRTLILTPDGGDLFPRVPEYLAESGQERRI